jgi:hypothetical protein
LSGLDVIGLGALLFVVRLLEICDERCWNTSIAGCLAINEWPVAAVFFALPSSIAALIRST